MNKRNVIFIGLLIAFILVVVFFSIYQTKKIIRKIENPILPLPGEEKVTRAPRKLVPDNPADYGMVVFDDINKPRTQEEWDSQIHKKVEELKSEFPPEVWDKVKEKIKEEPQVTADKIRQIDEGIQKCEEILKSDPGNIEAKQKLERLMMLKSIAKELP